MPSKAVELSAKFNMTRVDVHAFLRVGIAGIPPLQGQGADTR